MQGLRILEYACEEASEHPDSPLHLWDILEREIKVRARPGGVDVSQEWRVGQLRGWQAAKGKERRG